MVALAAASTTAVSAQAPPPAPEVTSSGAIQAATPSVDDAAGKTGSASGTGQRDSSEPQQPATAKVAPPQTTPASSRQAAIEQEQAAKVPNLHPYVLNKDGTLLRQARHDPRGRWPRLAPVLRKRVFGRRLHARRSAIRTTSAATTRSTCAAATRSPATSAPRSSSSRRACSTAARSCRCSAAGARRRRSASTASGRIPRRTIETNYLFNQPYGSALFTDLPDAPHS